MELAWQMQSWSNCQDLLGTKNVSSKYQVPGFPAAWKIMENLENENSIFQTWKNHGIWKKAQNHGKIMEFQNTSMEKSWKNVLSCTRIIQKKFALRAHIPMMIMKLVLFVSYFVEKVWLKGVM